jgi:hypothetical protein
MLVKFLNLFFLLQLCQIAFYAKADVTNELYVTDNNPGLIYVGHSAEEHKLQLLAEAKTNRESLPAQDFPEGNWGAIMNGSQLSLRFDKQAYTNGEPITAILLIRNTTNQLIQYPNSDYPNEDGPFLLLATTDTGESMPSKEVQSGPISAGGSAFLAPYTQRKYAERLNNRYNLTNGMYLIHALVKTETVGGVAEIKSAAVPIKIESSHN